MNYFKRFLSALFVIFVFAENLQPVLCADTSNGEAAAFQVSAASAILIEAESGRVLWEKNSHEKLPLASITKVMSALVALDLCELNETVVVDAAAAKQEGSSIYLVPGESVTVETLLYGMLLESGNDAAMAIAEHCGGVECFAALMNKKAQQFGMTDTHFKNPSGLNEEGHYSTAYDIAFLIAQAVKEPDFLQISSTKEICIGCRNMRNHNKMLWKYPGVDGGKTGYTKVSGRTLATTAQKDGMRLIAVTLNAPRDWSDHETLYDFGYENFKMYTFSGMGKIYKSIPVISGEEDYIELVAAESFRYPVSTSDSIKTEISSAKFIYAPVESLTKQGSLYCFINGELIKTVELYTNREVLLKSKNIFKRG